MKGSSAKYLLIIGSGALIVCLLLLPRLPESLRDHDHVTKGPLDQKVDQAVAMVSSGSNPMEGIMLLREVLDEDSAHVGAILSLGYFSLQSNQRDKAKQRFEQVLSIDTKNVDAWWELAHLSIADNQFEKGLFQFEQVLNLDEERKYSGVHFFLGKVYASLGRNDEAKEQFQDYLPYAKDSVIRQSVEGFITELNDL